MWIMSTEETENSIGWMAREHWTDLPERKLFSEVTERKDLKD
jgi:hypothetical protein